MDPNQQKLTLEEGIKQVMQTLPLPIRRYLGAGKYSEVVKNLMMKYRLHIDQGSILEREIMLLLMGIESPDEFIQALAEEARLDQTTINDIMKEVNDRIFVPLREEMRRGVPSQVRPVQARPPGAAVPSYGPPPPRPPVPRPGQIMPPPPPKPPQPPPRPIEMPSNPSPVKPQTPRQVWTPPESVLIPANPSLPPRPASDSFTRINPPRPTPPRPLSPHPVSKRPGANQIVNPARLLEDHEEPHVEFHPPSPKATEGAVKAPPPPQTQKIPKPPAPASYSADPYREPIDEQ